jgi:hypothetical protein
VGRESGKGRGDVMAGEEIRFDEVRVMAETDKAFRLEAPGQDPAWFPKSCIDWVEPDDEDGITGMEGHTTTFYIEQWLAIEKGWA